jgi:hypothetical protein
MTVENAKRTRPTGAGGHGFPLVGAAGDGGGAEAEVGGAARFR